MEWTGNIGNYMPCDAWACKRQPICYVRVSPRDCSLGGFKPAVILMVCATHSDIGEPVQQIQDVVTVHSA